MPITAKDKVVIITGGAGEIGSALARRLVDEGAKVVLADVKDGSSLERDLKSCGEARFIQTDVGSEEQTRRLADETEKAYGRIDVLINNAGLFTACPWDQLTYDEWTTRMRVNVDGTFLATKAVVPAMRRQGQGKIINIGSDTVWMGTPGFAHYVASKGAVMAFTRAIANELGRDGITSVYVTPTLLDTPGTRSAFPRATSTTSSATPRSANSKNRTTSPVSSSTCAPTKQVSSTAPPSTSAAAFRCIRAASR